ncbi:hypothetical protein LEQ04_11685 [Riemerella anatipestifer]|nr:hypothetical protein LEQ04_11685 [Riemerella anatipestifer]
MIRRSLVIVPLRLPESSITLPVVLSIPVLVGVSLSSRMSIVHEVTDNTSAKEHNDKRCFFIFIRLI